MSSPRRPPAIELRQVREHNLQGGSVEIPHGRLVVVTGVSGSGKSSLVFDTLHALGERRYLETLSAHARRFLQRLPTPHVVGAARLSPSIALAQHRGRSNSRSTVGTLSGLYDLLRVVFARATGLEPRDFSFVTAGACEACRGIGSQDEVARELLVADAAKTLRQGALVPTTPTGYIVYSQVTVDALDTVCRAHGFDVDTPWCELSAQQQDVVFFGSDRVQVPFGKHSLESRMRWEGITAKPRELGHYRGLIPTIEEILRRSRNENALRFARSIPCRACGGSRLNERARSARAHGASIVDAVGWRLPRLAEWLQCDVVGRDALRESLMRRLSAMQRLGLSHLSCDRATSSLSGGEQQRLRLATIATAGMSGVTFVFDEPSIGLHASEEAAVLDMLRDLRDAGNTVVVVEHSEQALAAADHLIDLGPGAGANGGEVLFAGPPGELESRGDERSRTREHYTSAGGKAAAPLRERLDVADAVFFEVVGATARNLREIDARFALRRLNVVSGVAGAGKSTLVRDVLVAALNARIEGRAPPDTLRELRGGEEIEQIVYVDQAPIGRTPRSNPATYTGVFDVVRKLFAALPAAQERGFRASTFSFNTKDGGRCPACEGAGRKVVSMHGLPDAEIVCEVCGGRRFRDDVLEVRYRDRHSVLDVLEATIDEAVQIFAAEPKVLKTLQALQQVGLGYLQLGQPATTLSGGEAQRVKLAGELARGGGGRGRRSLFVLEEPTIGLHREDVAQLLVALHGLLRAGNTVVLVEHDLDVLRAADHIVDLGPGSGDDGGRICGSGTAEQVARADAPTGRALRGELPAATVVESSSAGERAPMRLRGVTTHNLADVDVDLPAQGLTVVTGVSGSGKSSLVFDTLHGESRARMTEHLSGYLQRQLGDGGVGARAVREATGLRPTIALAQQTEARAGEDLRSTVATVAGLHDVLRALYSRLGEPRLAAEAFSFFRREGACERCGGDGSLLRCDETRMIVDGDAPLLQGAFDVKNRVLRDQIDAEGRQMAILRAVAAARGFDLSAPWRSLSAQAQRDVLLGCGDAEFDVVWQHAGAGDEAHRWRANWPGIAGDIEREYERRLASGTLARRKDYEALMSLQTCPACSGTRLREPGRSVRLAGRTLPELCRRDVATLLADLAEDMPPVPHAGSSSPMSPGLNAARGDAVPLRTGAAAEIARDGIDELRRRLGRLVELGLGHLQLDRAASTLSAGERQRARIARQLSAPLFGCVYVLDEPTTGLHARDVQGLLQTLRELVQAGNAVLAVEHDPAVMAAADHVVEVGPGAGVHGGEIVATGAPRDLPAASRTAQLLAIAGADVPSRSVRSARGEIGVRGARLHHLQEVDVTFPVGCLTVVCGVSGSGKTSLVRGVLGASAEAGRAIGCDEVRGLGRFATVVDDAFARAARTRTACPATLLDVYGELCKRFAATDSARADEAHRAEQHVQDLWQFVEARASQEVADNRDAWVAPQLVVFVPFAAGLRIIVEQRREALVGINHHRAELPDSNRHAPQSDAVVTVEDRAARGESDQDDQGGEDRRQQHQQKHRAKQVAQAFDHPRWRMQRFVANVAAVIAEKRERLSLQAGSASGQHRQQQHVLAGHRRRQEFNRRRDGQCFGRHHHPSRSMLSRGIAHACHQHFRADAVGVREPDDLDDLQALSSVGFHRDLSRSHRMRHADQDGSLAPPIVLCQRAAEQRA